VAQLAERARNRTLDTPLHLSLSVPPLPLPLSLQPPLHHQSPELAVNTPVPPPPPAPPPQVPRPGEDDPLSVLHITPLRASRPLALRYLAQRLDLPLDRVVVLALAPQASGSAEGGDLLAGAYCSDMQDLLGGMQQVSGVGGASGCTSRSERPTLQGRACSGLGHQAIDAPADGTCWPACPVYTPSPPPSALTTHAGLPGDAG
jgi:hypothetical protein